MDVKMSTLVGLSERRRAAKDFINLCESRGYSNADIREVIHFISCEVERNIQSQRFSSEPVLPDNLNNDSED
jgi:hypothetical protein